MSARLWEYPLAATLQEGALPLRTTSEAPDAITASLDRQCCFREMHTVTNIPYVLNQLQAKDSVREKPDVDHVFRMRQLWLKAFNIAANAT